jgi:putative transposase
MKYEEVYMHDYTSPKEARQQLREYLQFYHHQRFHQSLDYQTPAAVYFRQADLGAVGQQ